MDDVEDLRSPFLETLRQNTSVTSLPVSEAGPGWDVGTEEEVQAENHGNQLGTFMGVYIPCMMSIFGVIIFLRLGWALGESGLLELLLIFLIAVSLVVFTTLSISAISTNGAIRGGGAYYMISRSLGPEFGGSIGLIFYLANSIGATFYIVGFVESVSVDPVKISIVDSAYLNQLIIGSVTLMLMTVIALVGANFFAKTSFFIFVILIASIVIGWLSLLVQESGFVDGFTGFSSNTFADNILPGYQPDAGESINFMDVFGIVFPAVTGIMAGANMSGDLRDPGRSIPKGTLSAIGTATATYVLLILTLAFTCSRHLLLSDKQVLQSVSFHWICIALGVWCSTISSALASIVGGSRVLQALARDDLIPVLSFFRVGSGPNDEPRRAVIMTWFLAQCALMLGDLNIIAPLISNFFLMSYAITNFACFVLRVSAAPNFRPRFRYFTWGTALLGAIGCVAIMFASNAIYASLSIFILTLVFAYIHYRAPSNSWGDVSQALIYHQVRKYLLRLDARRAHVKFWRPQILLLVSHPFESLALLDFVEQMKKGGLYVMAHMLHGDIEEKGEEYKQLSEKFLDLVDETNIKAFTEVVVTPSFRVGAQNLLMTAGLGGMKVNTVALGFPNLVPVSNPTQREIAYARSSTHAKNLTASPDPIEYVHMISDAIYFEKNIIITRNFVDLDKDIIVDFSRQKRQSMESFSPLLSNANATKKMTVDIWMISDSESATTILMLQLAYLLHQKDIWTKHTKIRVLSCVDTPADANEERNRLKQILFKWRLNAVVDVLVVAEHHINSYAQLKESAERGLKKGVSMNHLFQKAGALEHNIIMNELMRQHCSRSAVVFLPVAPPPNNPNEYELWLQEVNALSQQLPPTVLVYGGLAVMTTEI
eukprot:GFYU01006193.1.p1 GENE.GFYU01006193.1~~GFYU01006193.1.p1  ORF type:complete len:905 (+),score=254.32 GFYU01006193.1:71-2716(+)